MEVPAVYPTVSYRFAGHSIRRGAADIASKKTRLIGVLITLSWISDGPTFSGNNATCITRRADRRWGNHM